MAGERRLTAAEKGKGKMVEATSTSPLIHEPSATVEESAAESGLRRSTRNRNPRMRVTPPSRVEESAAESPRLRGSAPPPSRKRARDEDLSDIGLLTAIPSPPVAKRNGYLELFLEASPAVVTVAFDKVDGSSMVTTFRTGSILVAEENYAIVLTTLEPVADDEVEKFSVYFRGVRSEAEVHVARKFEEENLLLLLVRTDEKYEAVNLSSDALGYEAIFTISTLSGCKLNDKANAPLIQGMEGRLGFFKGTVGAPSCLALNASGEHVAGSENYFQLGFPMHDDIITLSNVDAQTHTAKVAMASPVFRLDGNMAGTISSDCDWVDSKIGLLAESIISRLKTEFGVEWKEKLKTIAKHTLGVSEDSPPTPPRSL